MSETQATNPDTATVTNLDARGADIVAELSASADTEGVAEVASSDEPTKKPAAKADDVAAAEPGDADKRRTERKARLDELRAKDQAKLAAKVQREQVDGATTRLAELEKELASTKVRAARLDALKDPQQLIATLIEEGVDAAALGEFIRTGGDPAALAAKRAKSELSPELEAIRKEIAAEREQREAIMKELQTERMGKSQREATTSFLSVASEMATDFPLASKWREKRGDDQLVAMAHAVGPTLPDGATYTDLLQLIEEQLEDFASLRGDPSPATKSPKTLAAAKAPVLTNRLAAGNSVVDDEDSPRDLDERARWVTSML